MSPTSSAQILQGLRVVEISAFVAAPLSGATLAAMGAEVVRVDRPGGGIDAFRWPLHAGTSLYWAGLNQGKLSVNVDMRIERGRELVTDLIAKAGTCLTNLPAVGWMSYERLAGRRPDLVMAVLTGDPDGSAAVDYTVNAAIGFPWVTGPEGAAGPVNHVLPAWDAMAGYLVTTGILAAELHRRRTGEGQLVSVSLTNVALSVAGHLGFLAEAQLNAEPRGRYGNYLFGTFGRDFETADGRHVMVVALTPRQWRSLVAATDIRGQVVSLESEAGVDLEQEGERFRLRERISSWVDAWIAKRSFADVKRAFEAHGVLWGPYQTFKELVRADPRFTTANPMIRPLDQPGIGRYLSPGLPLDFSRMERIPPLPAPVMGGQTRAVLASWLGRSDEELDELEAEHVIATASVGSSSANVRPTAPADK